MAAVFLLIAIPGLAVVYHITRPIYVSTAIIAIESSPLEQLPFFKEQPRADRIANHLVLLKSRSLREGVLEALPKESFDELLSNAQYTDYPLLVTNTIKRWMGRPPMVLSPKQRAIEELEKARMEFLDSREAPGVFNIRGSASKPRVAMDLVNTYIQVLLSRTRGGNQEEVRKVREFLEGQLQQVKESVAQSEQALTTFEQKRGRLRFGAQTELDLARLSQLEAALAETQVSREALSAQMATVRQSLDQAKAKEGKAQAETQTKEKGKDDAQAPPASIESLIRLNEFKAAQDRLAALEAKLASLRERYTEAHPLIKTTQEQVKNEQARVAQMARDLPVIPPPVPNQTRTPLAATAPPASVYERVDLQRQLASLEAEYTSLETKGATLRVQVERLRGGLQNLSQDERQFTDLRRSLEANRNVLSVLSDKLMAVRIQEQGETGVIRVIDPASFPIQSTQSKTQRFAFMILAMAGALAFCAAFGIEYLRQPVETEEDVLKTTGLPLLGYVGVIGNGVDGKSARGKAKPSSLPLHLESLSSPPGVHIELYRAIRATVETERLKNPFRSILVTSPGPNEGKSTTILNLAHVLQEFGRRVLVIEADLRRPALHRVLSLTNRPGLVDFLRGTAPFDEVCRPLPSGVTVIPSQAIRGDIASLLASPRAKELLDIAGRRFDLILVDSPPLLAVSDNLLLVTALDRVILVVKASVTSKRDLRKCQAALQRANAQILGVVLNQANPRDVQYYRPRYRKYYKPADGKETAEASRHSRLLSWRRKG
jgi:capsular exopolysaccharide synthesis family protein